MHDEEVHARLPRGFREEECCEDSRVPNDDHEEEDPEKRQLLNLEEKEVTLERTRTRVVSRPRVSDL